MQWKDMDCPTFTEICNSAFKWLDCCNSFSGIQVDYLWQTTCILERQLLVSIVQNQHASYSLSSSRNADESCYSWVWIFRDNASVHKSLVAEQTLCDCEFWLGSQWLFPDKKAEVQSSLNLVYRRWNEDRCRGMDWESKQRIQFLRHKSWEAELKNSLILQENVEKWHYVSYNMLILYSQVAELFDCPSY